MRKRQGEPVLISTILAMLLILCILILTGCAQRGPVKSTVISTDTQSTWRQTEGEQLMQGNVVFTLTDAPPGAPYGANGTGVSQINMSIRDIQLHDAVNGWVSVNGKEQMYDLLALHAQQRHALIANLSINNGTYSAFRFTIDSVAIVDDNGSHEAFVPNATYTAQMPVQVESNSSAVISLDILSNESLHVASDGSYVFAPAAQVQSRAGVNSIIIAGNSSESSMNGEYGASANGDVRIDGGTIIADQKIGMDLAGNVGAGFFIAQDIPIILDNQINIGQNTSGVVVINHTGILGN